MGLFSFLKDSINKSREIREISALLSMKRSSKELIDDMLTQGPSDRDLAKQRLISLCELDVNLIMKKYSVTREHLNAIFRVRKLYARVRRISQI